jgi:hypothetical protein
LGLTGPYRRALFAKRETEVWTYAVLKIPDKMGLR